MMSARSIQRKAWFLIVVCGTFSFLLPAQTSQSSKPILSIGDVFRDLVEHYDSSSASEWDNSLINAGDCILAASTAEISNSLPAIFVALGHKDENVKLKAAFALSLISQRQDAASMLGKHVPEIADLYNSKDPRLQATPNAVFSSLYPTSPEVLPLMLTFISRSDRALAAQSGAVCALMTIAPADPRVLTALEQFMSRPLEAESRINTLHGIRVSHISDTYRVRKVVIEALDAPEKDVKLTAIEVLQRMGPDALLQSEPQLRKLTQNSAETVEVKDAAHRALRQVSHR
jgi:hypothetical protein